MMEKIKSKLEQYFSLEQDEKDLLMQVQKEAFIKTCRELAVKEGERKAKIVYYEVSAKN